MSKSKKMRQIKNIVDRYQPLFQSISIVSGWLLMFYATIFFILGLFLSFISNTTFGVSTLLTYVGLFILGFLTVREKKWNFIGWIGLTIVLSVLLFTIPNGIQLVYPVMALGLIAIFSYFGFAYKQSISRFAYVGGVVLFAIFVSHAFLLSNPQFFSLDVKEGELSTFTTEVITEVAETDPIKFSRTDTGRKVAIKVYGVSLFTSQEELEALIQENPAPIIEVQQLLLSTTQNFDNSPYGYIINVYLQPLIRLIQE